MTNRAVVIDGREMTKDQVREKGLEMLDIQKVEEILGPEPGDHGFFLAANLLSYYHVASVMKGMYVISKDPMTPVETRALVHSFIEEM
ncbi:hypothetical protein LCGC14_1801470 [marine sediment metagenome]|uniref:Uncharacterized protein n=1 Tax=marine sediment metagenome TaxID=412755 RepID=A0A0F9HC85_9ZZZZ